MPYLRTPLDDLLSSRSKLRLLRRLANGHNDLSGRELARRAGVTWRAAELALRDLVQLGVVRRADARGQARYSLVGTHVLIAHAVAPLFEAERAWIEVVRREISRALRPEGGGPQDIRWAGLYGSAARGEDRPSSDLDVAVVAESVTATARVRLQLQMPETRSRLLARIGRSPSVLVYPPAHWRKLIAANAEMRLALTRDAIRLMGDTSFEEAIERGA